MFVPLPRLIRAGAAVFAALALFSSPAFAGGGEEKGKGKDKAAGPPSNIIQADFELKSILSGNDADLTDWSEESPRAVDLLLVPMPAFHGRRLDAYFFVSIRLTVADGINIWDVRGKSHYLRDAVIRAAHTTSIGDPNDAERIEIETAQAVITAAAADVLGPDVIVDIAFTAIDTRVGS